MDFLLESLYCKNSKVTHCICNEFTTKLASLRVDFLKPIALGVKQGESRLSLYHTDEEQCCLEQAPSNTLSTFSTSSLTCLWAEK